MKRSSYITWDQLKVGVLILVAVLILAVAIVKLGQAGNLFGKRYHLVSFVSNASGLRGGVEDGKVLPPNNDTARKLILVVEVDRNMQEQVRKDSRAKIKTQGLLGDKVFDISVGTPRFAVLRSGDTILIAPSTDYDAVVAQAAEAINQVVGLTQDLKKVTAG